MKRAKTWLALACAVVLMLTITACGGEIKEEAAVTGIQLVEKLVNEGKYEDAYEELLKLDGPEAAVWKNKLVYVPVKSETVYSDGTRSLIEAWTYNEDDYPLLYACSRDGGQKNYAYDKDGRLSSYEYIYDEGDETASVTYDPATGQVSYEITDFLGNWVKETYDKNGTLLYRDYEKENGKESRWHYNALGDVVTIEDFLADGTTVKTTYNEKNLQVAERVIEADGSWHQVEKEENDAGQVLYIYVTRSDGSWEREDYTYRTDGKELSCEHTDSDSQWFTRTYTYDEKGNPLTIEEEDSKGDWIKTVYTYDDAGHLITLREDHSEGYWEEITYVYHQGVVLYKVETNSAGDNKKPVVKKDKQGRITSVRLTLGKGKWEKEAFTYDKNGRLSTRRWTNSRDDSEKTTYTYDPDGHGFKETIRNQYGEVEIRQYNEHGVLKEQKTQRVDGAEEIERYAEDGVTVLYTETLDVDGTRKVEEQNLKGVTVFAATYKKNGAYQKEWYDDDGNMTRWEAKRADGAVETTVYTYHENGEDATWEHTGFDGESFVVTYDQQGRILRNTDVDENGYTLVQEYEYDPHGNLKTMQYFSGGELDYLEEYTWKLVYYPNGQLPKEIR